MTFSCLYKTLFACQVTNNFFSSILVNLLSTEVYNSGKHNYFSSQRFVEHYSVKRDISKVCYMPSLNFNDLIHNLKGKEINLFYIYGLEISKPINGSWWKTDLLFLLLAWYALKSNKSCGLLTSCRYANSRLNNSWSTSQRNFNSSGKDTKYCTIFTPKANVKDWRTIKVSLIWRVCCHLVCRHDVYWSKHANCRTFIHLDRNGNGPVAVCNT